MKLRHSCPPALDASRHASAAVSPASTWRRRSSIVLAVAASILCTAGHAAVTVQTVTVGMAGNAADAATGLGAVGYTYDIGKYEVTAAEYTSFLNAVAATDTYGLYVANMANPAYSGITRSGSAGSYSYSVLAANANRPAQFVSYWSAARFANWLSNGQQVGLQGPGTTETGSYTLTPGALAGNSVTRNATATWVLPTESEWYKAAYYKGGSLNAGYWSYATQSNTLPGNDLADPGPGKNANLEGAGPYPLPIDGIHYTTLAGQFANSASAYGTFDQAGNVYEWNETVTAPTSTNGLTGRSLRGGSFGDNAAASIDPALFFGFDPAGYNAVSGFRVALVPEPSSWMLLAAGALALGWRAKRAAAPAP